MSKITDALHRAEARRRTQASYHADGSARQHYGVHAWTRAWEHAASGKRAAGNGHAAACRAAAPAADSTWEAAMARVEAQLAEIDARVARGAEERGRLISQMEEKADQVATLHREQQALEQQLASVDQALRGVDEERAACARQLASLRECQQLSQSVRAAEGELDANRSAVEKLLRTQEELAREMTKHQERDQALQQQIAELRFKLGQVLAFTGTTDADHEGDAS